MQYCDTPEWRRYIELLRLRPAAFRGGMTEIITDRDEVNAYYEKNGRRLGVVYESPYHLLVVDLVRESGDAEPFAYERLLPAVESGAVVAVPVYDGRFVLLRQFRHAPRESMLAFPRGFGEHGLGAEENLRKELREELGVSEVTDIRRLGSVAADSGVLGGEAEVYLCRVSRPSLQTGHEGIEALELLSERELTELIRAGEIKDGFTLAAFALYLAGK